MKIENISLAFIISLLILTSFVIAQESEEIKIGFDDLNFKEFIEKEGVKIPIVTKEIIECSKKYLEVSDLEDNLVSRLEISDNELNIQIVLDKTKYYPHCYNNIQDCDEDEVDCVYSGDGCKRCDVEVPSLGVNFVLIFLIVLAFLCIILLVWYVSLWRRMVRVVG